MIFFLNNFLQTRFVIALEVRGRRNILETLGENFRNKRVRRLPTAVAVNRADQRFKRRCDQSRPRCRLRHRLASPDAQELRQPERCRSLREARLIDKSRTPLGEHASAFVSINCA